MLAQNAGMEWVRKLEIFFHLVLCSSSGKSDNLTYTIIISANADYSGTVKQDPPPKKIKSSHSTFLEGISTKAVKTCRKKHDRHQLWHARKSYTFSVYRPGQWGYWYMTTLCNCIVCWEMATCYRNGTQSVSMMNVNTAPLLHWETLGVRHTNPSPPSTVHTPITAEELGLVKGVNTDWFFGFTSVINLRAPFHQFSLPDLCPFYSIFLMRHREQHFFSLPKLQSIKDCFYKNTQSSVYDF